MKLEYGKRYITRDGRVTGPLESNPHGNGYCPFWCGKIFRSWDVNGRVYGVPETPSDLIAEYQAPKTKRKAEKKGFAIGDRVAVYGAHTRSGLNRRLVGTIQRILETLMRVECEAEGEIKHLTVTPQQCRRLKKKERWEIFIYRFREYPYDYTDFEQCRMAAKAAGAQTILRVRVVDEREVGG